jgi:hypothetical protein
MPISIEPLLQNIAEQHRQPGLDYSLLENRVEAVNPVDALRCARPWVELCDSTESLGVLDRVQLFRLREELRYLLKCIEPLLYALSRSGFDRLPGSEES